MNVTDGGIRERMSEWNTRKWKPRMNKKSSQRIYKE